MSRNKKQHLMVVRIKRRWTGRTYTPGMPKRLTVTVEMETTSEAAARSYIVRQVSADYEKAVRNRRASMPVTELRIVDEIDLKRLQAAVKACATRRRRLAAKTAAETRRKRREAHRAGLARFLAEEAERCITDSNEPG